MVHKIKFITERGPWSWERERREGPVQDGRWQAVDHAYIWRFMVTLTRDRQVDPYTRRDSPSTCLCVCVTGRRSHASCMRDFSALGCWPWYGPWVRNDRLQRWTWLDAWDHLFLLVHHLQVHFFVVLFRSSSGCAGVDVWYCGGGGLFVLHVSLCICFFLVFLSYLLNSCLIVSTSTFVFVNYFLLNKKSC